MSNRSWCPRCAATWSSSTTWSFTSSRRSGSRWKRPGRISASCHYSPDFNPIEQAFAKLKAFFRAARPRSFDHVCDLMARAIELFTATECTNYVRHCGYRVATTL
jgi:hypothetical protein